MENSEIVEMMDNRLREAVEQTIQQVMNDINAQEHKFVPTDDTLKYWAEPGDEEILSILWSLDVSFVVDPPVDPIIQKFKTLAEKGDDPEAEMLRTVWNEIDSNGFLILYETKGAKIFQDTVDLFEKIGSNFKVRLVRRALQLLEENKWAIERLRLVQKEIPKLDYRYSILKEDASKLFLRYRKTQKSRFPGQAS